MSPGYDLYDNPDGSSLVYLNASDFESGTAVNVTKHVGFLHGFVEAITVILVSEVGDKTFFIAAILAMSNNKLTVFLAAISALALMTVLSALFGWVVTKFIPRTYTYYTCTVIMFLFGLKMLYEAWKMKPDEATELENEVREELERRGSIASSIRSNDAENNAEDEDEEGDSNHSSIAISNLKQLGLPAICRNKLAINFLHRTMSSAVRLRLTALLWGLAGAEVSSRSSKINAKLLFNAL